MSVHFLEPARTEFEDAVAYYQERESGLGKRFAHEVQETIERIQKDPASWEKLSHAIHRCCTKGFPYAILYNIEGDDILIVAVVHLHRRPGYWKDRLSRE